MIHPTFHPAFMLRESKLGFSPLLYPFQDKRGNWIEIRSCLNRSAGHALKCALKWLETESVITRRELANRGWPVQPLPIPDLELPGLLSQLVACELFETENIYDLR